jgi:hypothetical protein
VKVTCIHNGSIEVRLEPENAIETAFLKEVIARSAMGQKLVVATQPGNDDAAVIRMDRS